MGRQDPDRPGLDEATPPGAAFRFAYVAANGRMPGADEIARHLHGRGRFRVSPGRAEYENDQTGVTFTIELDRLALRVPVPSSPGVGLEAEIEARALADAFGLVPAAVEGAARAPGRSAFLEAFTRENRAAHRSLIESEKSWAVRALPHASLTLAWQWNFQRARYQRALGAGEMLPCVVPRVVVLDHPSNGRRVSTGVVWSAFGAIALPAVDIVVLYRRGKDGPVVRHVAWEDVAPLLSGFEIRAESRSDRPGDDDAGPGLRHHLLSFEEAPARLTSALLRASNAGGLRTMSWSSVRCEEHAAEGFVLPVVDAVARGEPAPPDLRITLSRHRRVLALLGGGELEESAEGADTGEVLGTATADEVRDVAARLVASGFPGTHTHAGDARLGVAWGGLAVSADATAAFVAPAVEAIEAIEHRFAAVSAPRPSRRSSLAPELPRSPTRRAALEAAARGQGAISPTVSNRSAPNSEVAITVGSEVGCTVMRDGTIARSTLGVATPEERRHLAELFARAGGPDVRLPKDDGSFPRVAVSVRLAGLSPARIETTAAALESAPGLAAFFDAVYAITRRIGSFQLPTSADAAAPHARPEPTRPMVIGDLVVFVNRDAARIVDMDALYDDGTVTSGWLPSRIIVGDLAPLVLSVPTRKRPPAELDLEHVRGIRFTLEDGTEASFGEDPPRAAGGSESLAALLDLTDGISTRALLRALAEAVALGVVGAPTGAGRHVPKTFDLGGARALPVFSGEAAFEVFAKHVGRSNAPKMHPSSGADVLIDLDPGVTSVQLDPGTPAARDLRGTDLENLRAVARAVLVERALASSRTGLSAALCRAYEGYLVPVVKGEGGAPQLITVARGGGEPLAVACTADDAIEALFAARPELASRVEVMKMPGSRLFPLACTYGVTGLTWNPYGPAPTKMSMDECRRIAALK
jgi:hypothetical protein